MAWPGSARLGVAGFGRQGMARHGLAGEARRGEARHAGEVSVLMVD